MKRILTSSDQISRLKREYAEQNHGACAGIQIETLSTALEEPTENTDLLTLQLSKLLLSRKKNYPVYGNMFLYPAFLFEIINFCKKCILYSIDPTTLPERNANEEELKRIVQDAMTLSYCSKEFIKKIPSKMESLKQETDISIEPMMVTDIFHYNLLQELRQTIPLHSLRDAEPEISLRCALTARQEVEAIAQDICKRGTPCTIILTNSSIQIPLIKMVLEQYNIRYSLLNATKTFHVAKIFASLLRFAVYQNKETFLACLSLNAFHATVSGPVFQYLKDHLTENSFSNDTGSFLKKNAFFADSAPLYTSMDENTSHYLRIIQKEIQSLTEAETIQEILSAAYAIIKNSRYVTDSLERKETLQIRHTIQSSIHLFEKKEELLFFASMIEAHTTSYLFEDSDFCIVTDLQHPVPTRAVSYVLSADSASYPGVPSETGLFDETYVEAVQGYPTSDARYTMYMEQLQWIEHSAKEQLIYSWHTNDYQGREVQLAVEIESKYRTTIQKWDLAKIAPEPVQGHILHPETATKLFFQDGTVTGSISTIEKWFHCPYSYFLQSGLKVRKPDTGELNAASIGTVQHAVLEHAVNTRHKDYASITEEEIRSFIEDAFAALEKMHPNILSEINITKERMIRGLMITLQFLGDFEKHTSFEPTHTEMRFCEPILDGVNLRGIIDRVDEYAKDMFRILDYKSSPHDLKEKNVKAGIQLQLLSYAIIAEKLTGKLPAGAYYYSFKQDNYAVPAYASAKKDTKKTEGEILDTDFSIEAEEERMFQNKSLCGWTFTDRIIEDDDDQSHIKSVKKQVDWTMVKECVLELYSRFQQGLLRGSIELSPDEEACTFCDYACICRFRGDKRKITPLLMEDESFLIGKKGENE